MSFEGPRQDEVAAGRRRLAAAAALFAGFLALVLVIATSGGSDSDSDSKSKPKRESKARPAPAAKPRETAASKRERKAATFVASGRGTLTANPRPVPILMYHVIRAASPGDPNPDLFVSRDDFADAMEELDRNGYEAVTLNQVWAAWHEQGKLPSKPVVVSFDDGFGSHYYNALPILKRHGWAGVLNLAVNNMAVSHDLEESEVRELIAAGWELDSHTIAHEDVTTLDTEGLEREIAGSRAELRRLFKVPVNFFCYPAGQFDDTSVEAVKAAGYKGATTVVEGLADPDSAYTMDRVRVNAGDGGAEVLEKLSALEP